VGVLPGRACLYKTLIAFHVYFFLCDCVMSMVLCLSGHGEDCGLGLLPG